MSGGSLFCAGRSASSVGGAPSAAESEGAAACYSYVVRAVALPCPPGFDFHATAAVLKRGPADPLVWFDGHRWRRRLVVEGYGFLVEVRAAPADGAAAEPGRGGGGLSARVLAGRAPRPVIERVIGRVFGLDEPARELRHRIPEPVRRAISGAGATAALPGYPTLFEALVHTILGQQISAASANAQRAAFALRFGGPFAFKGHVYWTFPDPAGLTGERLVSLRRTGLSTAKALAVRGLARAFGRAGLAEAALAAMPADAAIDTLTALPGIGRWTAEWVLLRALRRFDVVPAGDLAVRKALTWFAGRQELLSEAGVRDLTARWAPYGGLIAFRLLLAHRRAGAAAPPGGSSLRRRVVARAARSGIMQSRSAPAI